MKQFQEPQIEVISLNIEDVVTTSTESTEPEMTFIGDCLGV